VPAFVLGLCAALTVHQLTYWRSNQALFAHAAAVTSKNSVAYMGLGSEAAAKRDYLAAKEWYSKAIAADPTRAEPFNLLGEVQIQEKLYGPATTNFQQAAVLNRFYCEPLVNLSRLAFAEKNYVEAEFTAREAVKRAPSSQPSRVALGKALQAQGKLDQAQECFDWIVVTNPRDSVGHKLLANVMLAQGNPADAIRHYRQSLQLFPRDPEVHLGLGMALLRQNETSGAEREFSVVLESEPANPLANLQLGLILQTRGELAAAVHNYEAVLATEPDNFKALNNLAWIRATASDSTLRNGVVAVRLASHLSALTGGTNFFFLGTLSVALAEAGKFVEAASTAERAVTAARAAGRPDFERQSTTLLELFKKGEPFRSP
jgi:tetratricopeptide (TPR) repeat protein